MSGLSVSNPPGVWNARAFPLVVFMPRGARVRGPASQLVLVLHQICDFDLHTHWSDEGILVDCGALLASRWEILGSLSLELEDRLSLAKAGMGILIVEWYADWCLRVSVCWSLWRHKVSCRLVQWLRGRDGLVPMDKVLLVASGQHGCGVGLIVCI